MSKHDRKLALREVRERLEALSRKPKYFDQLVMAGRVEQARTLCGEAFQLYGGRVDRPEEGEVWKKAAALASTTLAEAFPPNFAEDWNQLKQGNAAGLEMAITFLEKDPWFFRSGYVKADLIRMICHVSLSSNDIARLQKVVLNAIDLRDRREFRKYCYLAKIVKDESFRQRVEQRTLVEDAGIKRRARWVMLAICSR